MKHEEESGNFLKFKWRIWLLKGSFLSVYIDTFICVSVCFSLSIRIYGVHTHTLVCLYIYVGVWVSLRRTKKWSKRSHLMSVRPYISVHAPDEWIRWTDLCVKRDMQGLFSFWLRGRSVAVRGAEASSQPQELQGERREGGWVTLDHIKIPGFPHFTHHQHSWRYNRGVTVVLLFL